MARKDDLGRAGEKLAADHVTALGWRIIDRNWRCPHGELDIVAHDGEATVFVEVKTRSSDRFGHPLDAITPGKLARLRRLAGAWCAAQSTTTGRIRIDVIAVIAGRAGITLDHVRAVG